MATTSPRPSLRRPAPQGGAWSQGGAEAPGALPRLSGPLRAGVVAVPLAAAALVAVVVPAAAALAPGLAAAAAPLLLLAAVLVGLPHGAVDLLQPELTPRRRSGRALVGLAYVGLVALAVLVLRLAPLPVLGALLVLAALHFGLADDVVHRWRTGATSRRTAGERVAGAVRVLALGGVPVAAPLALGHADVVHLLDVLSGGSGAAVVVGARVALVPVLAAVLATALLAVRRRDAVGAVEPLVLAALFLPAPPLPAFAAYFGLWHSLRHLLRLLALDAVRHGDGGSGRPVTAPALHAAGRRFARAAALPTGMALAGLVVLVLVAGGDVVPAALVLVLCLTVPHAAAVALADRALLRR
ncbi:beta-carotene 15,15'-dioxygenase, Brp/Blh family [Pseudokineococcus sp. 5B2Z-1]|uniref:beta-carotene 15,15'-dioxygenase, Brp/Blh family n=1 Tax=Pseudokineococcus sp. 5B2Z-1 TaxID=3132744 RepID=UPI0030B49951